MNKQEYLMGKIKEHYEHLEHLGYTVVAIFLNNPSDYEFDQDTDNYSRTVNTKAIIAPSFKDIIKMNSMISTTETIKDETIEVNDVRLLSSSHILSQNLSYLELLYTDYKLINPKFETLLNKLFSMRDKLARYNERRFLESTHATAYVNFLSINYERDKQTAKLIATYGYNPNEFFQLMRKVEIAEKYVAGKSFTDCLTPTDKDYFVNIKKGTLSLAEVKELSLAAYDKLLNKLIKKVSKSPAKSDNKIAEELFSLELSIFKEHLREDMINN